VKSYVVQDKAPDGRDRRMTLGKHGAPLTLEEARKLAVKRLLEVKNDRDPAEERLKRIRRRAETPICFR